MAEIDASIIGKLQPPKADPLGTAAKALSLGQGVLQNRLLGQQVGGKVALGRAVTAATDPNTGVTDWTKALSGLAQDPQGSFAVPEFAGQVLDRQIKELQLSGEDLKLSAQRWGKVGDTATALLADKEPLTREKVIKSLADNLVSSGLFNDDHSVGMLTNFVSQLPTDDAGLRQKLKEVGLQSNMTSERIAALLGPVSSIDTGSTISQVQTSPVTGEVNVVGALNKQRTPSEKAALVPVYDPVTKTTRMVPSGTLIGDAGTLPKDVGAQGPALGVATGAEGAAAGAVKQAQDLRIAAEKVPENNAALRNIRDQLDKFTPGPKSDWTYLGKAIAQQLGVAPPSVTEGVAGQEEFNKLATQFINQQVGALGGTGTDAKLESARHGTPNEFMSKEGIRNVTNLMMGLNDALGAKNAAWQKWLDSGKGPETYGQFQTQFNAIYNPRVFQSQYMTDAQKTNMLKNMTAKERTQFQKDWTFAKRAGWLE